MIKEQWDEIVEEYAWFLKNRARSPLTHYTISRDLCRGRFTRSIGDSCMKDVECARFYNERVPDGLAKMLPLPKKPYVSARPTQPCLPWNRSISQCCRNVLLILDVARCPIRPR